MKITKEIWLKATAEAMSTGGCKELFKSDHEIEELFTDYSFYLFTNLSGKTLDETDFIQAIIESSAEIFSEVGLSISSVLIQTALMCFAKQIWDSLLKLTESDRINTEHENFRTALKSQKSE